MRGFKLVGAGLWLVLSLALSACAGEGEEPFFDFSPARQDLDALPVQYSFITPDTEEGETCVLSCQRTRTQCAAWQRNQYQACQRQAGTRQNTDCGSPFQRSSCKSVSSTRSCPKPDLALCASQYRACFEQCGGQVLAGGAAAQARQQKSAQEMAAEALGEDERPTFGTGSQGAIVPGAENNLPAGELRRAAEPVAPLMLEGSPANERIELLSVAPDRGPDAVTLSITYVTDPARLSVTDADNPASLRTFSYGKENFKAEQDLAAMGAVATQYGGGEQGNQSTLILIAPKDGNDHFALIQSLSGINAPTFALAGAPDATGMLGLERVIDGAYLGWSALDRSRAAPYYGNAETEVTVRAPQGQVKVTLAVPAEKTMLWSGASALQFTANLDPDSNLIWGEQLAVTTPGDGAVPYDGVNVIGGLYDQGKRVAIIARFTGSGTSDFVAYLETVSSSADAPSAARGEPATVASAE